MKILCYCPTLLGKTELFERADHFRWMTCIARSALRWKEKWKENLALRRFSGFHVTLASEDPRKSMEYFQIGHTQGARPSLSASRCSLLTRGTMNLLHRVLVMVIVIARRA